jgi:hypothetical protein
MAHISRRLELATGFRVFKTNYNYTSENYQIMNYGLGGKIGLHMDHGQKVSQLYNDLHSTCRNFIVKSPEVG